MKNSNRNALTKSDVLLAQSIGRKSINSLTSVEINNISAFAQKYWNELGVKSPFFRAYFGDWRANDTAPITLATKKDATRGLVKNSDTGWLINISGQVFNETKHHQSSSAKAAVQYLPYIRDIIKKSILLDSSGIDPLKSENSILMHSFYTVADVGKKKEVLKLYVEEIYNPNSQETNKRAYELKNIEKAFAVSVRVQNNPSSLTNTANAVNTVADLFALVKLYDSDFNPNNASKIVNADGTPKVMYHGTPAQFTAFDKKKAKSSGFYGRGFYFTDSKSHSNQYGNSMAVYLNVKNPLAPGENALSKTQLKKFLEAVAENEDDYDIWNYGTENIDEIVSRIYKDDAFAVIQDVNATAIGDFAEALRLFNDVNGTSFDGIVTPTETVVFEPTQIKSATDNIGTFDGSNPDIRYSDRDYSFDPELVADLQADRDKLKSDVDNLKELLKLQRTVTHGTAFTKTSVNAAASKLMKSFGMHSGKAELTSALNEFYRFVASSEELSWEAVMAEAGMRS